MNIPDKTVYDVSLTINMINMELSEGNLDLPNYIKRALHRIERSVNQELYKNECRDVSIGTLPGLIGV